MTGPDSYRFSVEVDRTYQPSAWTEPYIWVGLQEPAFLAVYSLRIDYMTPEGEIVPMFKHGGFVSPQKDWVGDYESPDDIPGAIAVVAKQWFMEHLYEIYENCRKERATQ